MSDISKLRKFEFNALYIIESLDPLEPQTGSSLYYDNIRWRADQLKYLYATLICVDSKRVFREAMIEIRRQILTEDKIPFFHFEIHGSKEGLVLNSGELVTWMELCDTLREMNVLVKNNIFVALVTCFGAYITSAILPSQPAPFFSFVGTWDKLYYDDILEPFDGFYHAILNANNHEEIDFNLAVQILNQYTDGPPKYQFINSERVFDKVIIDYQSQLGQSGGYERRVNDLMFELMAKLMPPVEQLTHLKGLVLDKLVFQGPKIELRMRDKFLMKDIRAQF